MAPKLLVTNQNLNILIKMLGCALQLYAWFGHLTWFLWLVCLSQSNGSATRGSWTMTGLRRRTRSCRVISKASEKRTSTRFSILFKAKSQKILLEYIWGMVQIISTFQVLREYIGLMVTPWSMRSESRMVKSTTAIDMHKLQGLKLKVQLERLLILGLANYSAFLD